MPIRTLFNIPDFLKDGDFAKVLFENIKLDNYEIGSDEWIELMRQEYDFEHFADDDIIENENDFANLINVCNFWKCNFCPSIFIYYMYNQWDNNYFFNELLRVYGFDIESFRVYIYDVLSKKSKIIEPFDEIEENFRMLYSNIPEHQIYSYLDSTFARRSRLIEKYPNTIIPNEERKLIDLDVKLKRFCHEYSFLKRKEIKSVGIVPYDKNAEISGPSYYVKYRFEFRYAERNIIICNIYHGRIHIVKFLLNNMKVLIAMKNSIEHNIHFTFFDLGFIFSNYKYLNIESGNMEVQIDLNESKEDFIRSVENYANENEPKLMEEQIRIKTIIHDGSLTDIPTSEMNNYLRRHFYLR